VNLLSVERLSKSYGTRTLFSELTFGIEKGEKVALIARNGSGKSTLLNLLAGTDSADSGTVTKRRDIRFTYLEQDPVLDDDKTILQYLFETGTGNLDLVSRYEALLDEQIRSPEDPRILEELHRAGAEIEERRAWDAESRVRQIFGRLDIHDLQRTIGTLSGGLRKRIALARVLLDEPDLLLMDEPTNHLDVDMIEWLEEYFANSSCGLLLVTHDRYFLDNVCSRILELENGRLYTYDGGYDYFLEKKAEREAAEASELSRTRNIYRKELEWMRRMPRARGTKSKSRVDAFGTLSDKARGRRRQETLSLDVKMNRIGGKVLEMKKVYKSFGGHRLLKGFDYTFRTGERIGIVGKNGSGKTTFLNLVTGRDTADSGKINVGDTVIFGYYAQQGLQMKEDKRVIEAVKDIADIIPLADGTKVPASAFLQLFMFPPDLQQTYVSRLSGGERRRLHLLMVLMKNPNFLILDEPTNDLDLLTLATLEDFLLHYRGCLLIVSHDRYFMDRLVDHLFVFEGDAVVRDFNGTYSEYRLQADAEARAAARAKSGAAPARTVPPPPRRKAGFREQQELAALEAEIPQLEKERDTLTEQLHGGGGHQDLLAWASRLEEVLRLLETKTNRWIELSDMM
jgi:ATP-binding cassette subfamily F protein uup